MNSTKWLAVVVLVVAVLAAAMLWHMQYGGRGKAKRPVSSTSIATQTSLPTTLNVVEQKNEVSPTAAATAGGHEVPLKTDLPKPMLGPTPKPIPPGLRVAPKLQGLRPDFMIPLGCTNLALGKKVTSNDSEPVIGELSLITDGDKEMQEGNYVELAIGKQWVQVDLGFPETLAAIPTVTPKMSTALALARTLASSRIIRAS
ncbi:MAG: hypothetical protein NTY53_07270 [Kiritimatiellaeota bacterium]|nr:hypothetical protein [Kiritimatiellota bacterium]